MTATYLVLGGLNAEQASRIGLLGLVDLLLISAWTTRKGTETKLGKAWVLAAAFVFLLFMSFQGFVREYFGLAPDDNMVMATLFNSDRSEAGEFLEQEFRPMIKHFALVLGLGSLFALVLHRWPRPRPATAPVPSLGRQWATVGAFGVVFVLAHLNSSMRNMDTLLYFSSRYSLWKHQIRKQAELQAKMAGLASDPQLDTLHCQDEAPRTVVFMLGESTTRLDFPYVGYARNTTPELGALGDKITWFSNVLSCDPTTVPALRKILTPATIAEPDLWLHKPDLFLMARKTGYKTFWLSNHSTDSNGSMAVFLSHVNRVVLANRGASRGESSFDEVLLPLLDEALKDPAPRKFIVLHMLGAHPAYYYRYPKAFDHFNKPDAVSRELKASGRAFWAISLRNCYDNALLYMDHVLTRSVDLCRSSGQRAAWLFVPDHGHDAAHYNNFCGHNVNAQSQYEIPIMFWHADSFPSPQVDKISLASRAYQTDVLDHTLLGLMDIVGDYYDPHSDVLSAAFEPSRQTIQGGPWAAKPAAP
jgi:heptose-I-phosphate ethanolaminephosphotransferase